MRKTICDRCGNDIKDITILDPEGSYMHYDVRATMRGKIKFIDLCPSCEKELSNWLHNIDN